MTKAFRDVAGAFAAAFETAQRPADAGGADFIRLKNGSPEWMTDVIRAAHMSGEMLPDDWRYRFIRGAADGISEILDEKPDAPDLGDEASERIDGLVPVYNAERTDWLGSHSYRPSYVDEACEDCATASTGILERIGYGIYAEIQEIWDSLSSELSAIAERDEAGESMLPPVLLARGFAVHGGGSAPDFIAYDAPDGAGHIVATSQDGGEPSFGDWLIGAYAGALDDGQNEERYSAGSGGETSLHDALNRAFAAIAKE